MWRLMEKTISADLFLDTTTVSGLPSNTILGRQRAHRHLPSHLGVLASMLGVDVSILHVKERGCDLLMEHAPL